MNKNNKTEKIPKKKIENSERKRVKEEVELARFRINCLPNFQQPQKKIN